MASIQIIGKLGNNAEIKNVNNSNVAEFSIAETIGSGTNKKTIWYKCSMWKGANTGLIDYLKKGSEFLVIGELQSQGTGQNGTVYNNVFVYDLKFTGGSTSRNQQQSQPQNNGYQQNNQQGYQNNQQQPRQQQNNGYNQQPRQQQAAPASDLDDGLPF